jgi:peptidyl-prolyl cis-trans isomerase D
MFDWVNKHKRWLQLVLLVLIVPPFALFGINYYFQDSGTGAAVAKVAGTRISAPEFEGALRERQDQLRQMMQGKADEPMLNSSEVRNGVVNTLVENRAMLAHALGQGMTATDAQLAKVITEIPAFQDRATGKFSEQRYQEILKGQGLTPAGFEERVRRDLALSQLRETVTRTNFVASSVTERLGRIREQQREVSQLVFAPARFMGGDSPAEAELNKYYEEKRQQFSIPERARVEYVVLAAQALENSVEVTADEVRAFYDSHSSQYSKPEERRASHILLTVSKDATAEAKATARAKAEALVQEARKAPQRFSELARANSQDPGSAASGGDLGFVARGAMVKPFEDALFGLKPGEIAGPVETQYGFHVIRLDGIKAGEATPLEKVRREIEQEVRKPKIGKLFAEAVESFQNIVYEQPDSLKPAADALKLTIQTSDWITRNGGGNPQLSKPALLGKIFSEDAIKNKRNTEAVDMGDGTFVAARVLEHKAADFLPFDQVKSDITVVLMGERARKRAAEEGKAALERLRKGDTAGATFEAPQLVSLQAPGSLLVEAAREVFSADAAKLPAYIGATAADGRYVVYRVSKVLDGKPVSAEEAKSLQRQIAQLAAQQQLEAYTAVVKAGAGVEIDASKVERKGP